MEESEHESPWGPPADDWIAQGIDDDYVKSYRREYAGRMFQALCFRLFYTLWLLTSYHFAGLWFGSRPDSLDSQAMEYLYWIFYGICIVLAAKFEGDQLGQSQVDECELMRIEYYVENVARK